MPNKRLNCGLLKPDALFPNRLSIGDICGDIWMLRALEVACVGRHTLTLAGMGLGLRMAESLGQWALRRGASVRVVPTLPKTKYASAVDIYRRSRRFQQALQADIWLVLPDEPVQPNAAGRSYVADSHLAAIEAGVLTISSVHMPTRADFAPESTLAQMYDAAQRFAEFARRFEKALVVAATIAALAGATDVDSGHLSEALQYGPAIEFWPRGVQ